MHRVGQSADALRPARPTRAGCDESPVPLGANHRRVCSGTEAPAYVSGRRRMPRPADAAWCWADESADCHLGDTSVGGSSLSMTTPALYHTLFPAARGGKSSAGPQPDAREAALGDTDPASGRVAGIARRPPAARGLGQSLGGLHGSHRAHRRGDRPQREPHGRLLRQLVGGTHLRHSGARTRDAHRVPDASRCYSRAGAPHRRVG